MRILGWRGVCAGVDAHLSRQALRLIAIYVRNKTFAKLPVLSPPSPAPPSRTSFVRYGFWLYIYEKKLAVTAEQRWEAGTATGTGQWLLACGFINKMLSPVALSLFLLRSPLGPGNTSQLSPIRAVQIFPKLLFNLLCCLTELAGI